MSYKENGEYSSNNPKENSMIDIDLSSVESLLVSPKKLSEVLKELAPNEDLTIYVWENDTYFVKLKNRRGKEINQPLEIQRSDFLKCVSAEGIITLEWHKLVIKSSDTADEPPTIDEFLLWLNEEISEVVVHDFPKIERKDMLINDWWDLENNLRVNPALLEQIQNNFEEVRNWYFDFYKITGRHIFSSMELFDSRTKINYCITDIASDNAAFCPVWEHEFLFRLCTKNNYLSLFDYYTIAHEIWHSWDLLSVNTIKLWMTYENAFDQLYQKKLQRLWKKRNLVNEEWRDSQDWNWHDKFLGELFADSRATLLYFWNYAKKVDPTNINFKDWEKFKKNGHVSEEMVEEIRNLKPDSHNLQRFFANDQWNHLLVKILNFDPSEKKNQKTIERRLQENESTAQTSNYHNSENSPIQFNENHLESPNPEKLLSDSLSVSEKILDFWNQIQKKYPDVYQQNYTLENSSVTSFSFSVFEEWVKKYQEYLKAENILSFFEDKSWWKHIMKQMEWLNAFFDGISLDENSDTFCILKNWTDVDISSWLEGFSSYFYNIMGSLNIVKASLGEISPEEALRLNDRFDGWKFSIQLEENMNFYNQYQRLKEETMDLKREYWEKYWEIMSSKYHALQYQKEKNILDRSLQEQLISQEEYDDKMYAVNCFYRKVDEVTRACGSNLVLQEQQLAYWDTNKGLLVMENKINDGIINNKEQFVSALKECIWKKNALDQTYMFKILQQWIDKQLIPADIIVLIKEYLSCNEKLEDIDRLQGWNELEQQRRELYAKKEQWIKSHASQLEDKISRLWLENNLWVIIAALNDWKCQWKDWTDVLEFSFGIYDDELKKQYKMSDENFENMKKDRWVIQEKNRLFNVFPFDKCEKYGTDLENVDWKSEFTNLWYDSFENMLNHMRYLTIQYPAFNEWYKEEITEENINDFMKTVYEKMRSTKNEVDVLKEEFQKNYSLDFSHFVSWMFYWVKYEVYGSTIVPQDLKKEINDYINHVSKFNSSISELDWKISASKWYYLYNNPSIPWMLRKKEIEQTLSSSWYLSCEASLLQNLPVLKTKYY